MRWVTVAAIRPNRCAVIPYVGGNDPEGYIDTGCELDGFDNHVYVSVKAVNEMASLIGRPTVAQYQEVVDSNRAFVARLEEVTAELGELRTKQEAFDLLTSEGWRVRNKPGRPPKKKEEATV